MKGNLSAFLRRVRRQDAFKRTRRRMTLFFSGLLMLFLAVFIVIVYGLMYLILFNEQESEVQEVARQDLRAIHNYLKQNTEHGLDELDTETLENQVLSVYAEDQMFSYILGPDGQFIYGWEAGRWMRPQLLEIMSRNAMNGEKAFRETLHVPSEQNGILFDERPTDNFKPRKFRRPLAQSDELQIRMIASARPIMQDNHQIGVLIVGKNISFYYVLLDWLLYNLAGLALVFYGVAFYISYHMSRRAMIPMVDSYHRGREFIADASHELRTPLSILLSSIDTLQMEQTEATDPFIQRLLANMKGEVVRMGRMVSSLLTLANMEDQRLRWITADFVPYVEKTVQSMKPVAEQKQISLECSLSGPLVIHADAERLNQLLYILLDNAIKYTPDGGEIRVELFFEGAYQRKLCLIVADNGLGIAEEDQPRIFDRFYRTENSKSGTAGGHGLGLAIAKRIVDAHSGKIKVDSSPGQGSRFEVTIPNKRSRSRAGDLLQ